MNAYDVAFGRVADTCYTFTTHRDAKECAMFLRTERLIPAPAGMGRVT